MKKISLLILLMASLTLPVYARTDLSNDPSGYHFHSGTGSNNSHGAINEVIDEIQKCGCTPLFVVQNFTLGSSEVVGPHGTHTMAVICSGGSGGGGNSGPPSLSDSFLKLT